MSNSKRVQEKVLVYSDTYSRLSGGKMLSSIFDQFVKESPVTVMARGLMERIFAAEKMDELFANHAQVQYQRDLLFSSQVELMSLVVCGTQKSVHAAYKAKAVDMSISTTALYNKLNGISLLSRATAEMSPSAGEVS